MILLGDQGNQGVFVFRPDGQVFLYESKKKVEGSLQGLYLVDESRTGVLGEVSPGTFLAEECMFFTVEGGRLEPFVDYRGLFRLRDSNRCELEELRGALLAVMRRGGYRGDDAPDPRALARQLLTKRPSLAAKILSLFK